MRRATFAIGSAVLLLCTIILWLRATPQSSKPPQQNALWAQSLYFRGFQPTTKESLTTKDLIAFATTLRENGIKYAYMFAGPYDKDGHVPEYAFSKSADSSLKILKRLCPQVMFLP